jgi:hypothetical protein
MKVLTHLDAIKSRLSLSDIGKQKIVDETLNVYPHKKTFKERQQSTLDQQLMSTEQSHETQAISVTDNHGCFAQMFWVQVFH